MPAILWALGALLVELAKRYLPTLIGRLMLAIGIGFAVDQIAMPNLIATIQARAGGLPGLMASYFYALGFDVVATCVLSALAANATGKLLLKKL